MPALTRALPVLALLAVTALWGWTFVVVRDAVAVYPVPPFLALRFGLAALCLSPVLFRGPSGLRAGLVPGIALAAGYLAQTAGLRYTTASKAGLLTGLFVVITPALVCLIGRTRPRWTTVIAVLAAFAGTILLVGPVNMASGSQEMLGDALEIVTAICFSIHIVLLARLARDLNASVVALGQMAIATALFSATAGVTGGFPRPAASVGLAIIITGVLASALAFWVQTFVQQRVSASRTAIILASEPAFATLFGFLLAGDRFNAWQALGGGFILAAIAFHELLPQPVAQSRLDVTEPSPLAVGTAPAFSPSFDKEQPHALDLGPAHSAQAPDR